MLHIGRSSLLIVAVSLVFAGCGAFGESSPDTSDVPWELIPGKLAFAYNHRSGLENNFSGLSLYVLDGQAQELRQVRHWGDAMANLDGIAWSPDSQQMAFSYDDNPSNSTSESRIFVIDDSDGSSGDESLAFPDMTGAEAELFPAWSSDDKLAYLFRGDHARGFAADEVFVDGAPFFDCIVPGAISGRCEFITLGWSPNGDFMIVGMGDDTSQSALYRVDVADRTVTPLVQGPGVDNEEIFHSPQVSPDGTRVVFAKISLFGETVELWTINADGSDLRQVTSGHFDRQPTWSPDGSSIAFMRDVLGPPSSTQQRGVMLIDQNGGTPTQILPDVVDHLHWSR